METGFVILLCVLTLTIGVAIGWLTARRIKNSDQTLGFLYVIDGAPEGQDLFLTPTVPSSVIASQKRVIFDVDVIRQNSQK